MIARVDLEKISNSGTIEALTIRNKLGDIFHKINIWLVVSYFLFKCILCLLFTFCYCRSSRDIINLILKAKKYENESNVI